MKPRIDSKIAAVVTVAALGYFVDVYDLLLFSIVRVQSLESLGLAGEDVLRNGLFLLNMQMTGMLIGGIIWGVLGDKRGRLSVLFGSIFVYSAANIANAFVGSIGAYAFWRLIAGFGLAGELGAGITLVSESIPARYRGYGTTLVASVGVAGAVVASIVGGVYDWRVSYLIGGALGLLLFLLRLSVYESGLYSGLDRTVRRGSLMLLFSDWKRAARYFSCIFTGAPVWFVVGVLITLAPEFGAAFGMTFLPTAGKAVLWCYVGLVTGDIASGLLSQLLQSRKKVLWGFLALVGVSIARYLTLFQPSLFEYYLMCFVLGFAVGFWAVFITTASEQFGTNLRSTVTTTVPNFVRGSLVPLAWIFQELRPAWGIIGAAALVAAGALAISLVAVWNLRESFATDLDFVE